MQELSPTDEIIWHASLGPEKDEIKTPPKDEKIRKYSTGINAYFLLDLRLPIRKYDDTISSALRDGTPSHSPPIRSKSTPALSSSKSTPALSSSPPIHSDSTPALSSSKSTPALSSSPPIRSNSSDTSSIPSNSPPKYGFLQLLERIHGKDLTTNNRWLNPSANPRPQRLRYRREVRFSTTEIVSPELPHCRKEGGVAVKPGQLHAPTCTNAAHETVDVLGEHVWQNRVFILENSRPRDKSRDDKWDASRDHQSEDDGEESVYHKAEEGSLEELGVCDSLELTKRRLHLMNSARTNNQEPDCNFHDTSPEEVLSPDITADQGLDFQKMPLQLTLHPNMVLDLRSPGTTSDEESLTPASTLIQSDSLYSDSADDDVFTDSSPSHSSETTSGKHETGSVAGNEGGNEVGNERTEGPVRFTSSFSSYNFEMVVTPLFRKGTSDYGSSGSDFRVKDDTDLNEYSDKKLSYRVNIHRDVMVSTLSNNQSNNQSNNPCSNASSLSNLAEGKIISQCSEEDRTMSEPLNEAV